MRERDAKDKDKKKSIREKKGNKDQITFLTADMSLDVGAQLTRKIVKRLANVNRENR